MYMESTKVLLVENNVRDAHYLRAILRKVKFSKFNVIHVTNLQNAILQLNKYEFTAIILDLWLPDSQGIETLQKIRNVSTNGAIVAIGQKNYKYNYEEDLETIAIKIIQEGAQDYLLKEQINTEILTNSVLSAIARNKQLSIVQENQKEWQEQAEALEGFVQQSTRLLIQEKILMKSILNSLQEGICVSLNTGQIIMINPAAAKMYGLEKMTCMPCLESLTVTKYYQCENTCPYMIDIFAGVDIYYPNGEVIPKAKLPFNRVMRGEEFTDEEIMIRLANGEKKWLNVGGKIIRNIHGEILLGVHTSRDITLTKQAEEKVIRITQAVESTSDAIAMTDIEGKLIHVNQAFVDRYGYNIAELNSIDNPIAMYVGGKTGQEVLTAIKNNSSWSGEVELKNKNGEIIPTLMQVDRIIDDVGSNMGLIAVYTDISYRIHSDAALKSSEELFRQLAENIKEVFFLTSADSQEILYISPAYEEIWGRSCESLYENYDSWLESVHPEDRSRVVAGMVHKCQQNLEYDEEYRIIRPDGNYRWIWSRTFPICNEKGEVHRIAGIAEDITDRKQALEALRLTQFCLDRAADAVFWMKKNGEFFYVNDATCRLLGYSRSEFLGMTIQDIKPGKISPQNWQNMWAEIQQCGSLNMESYFLTKSGSLLSVEITANYVEFNGKAYNCVFLHDITDRKNTEAKLRQAKEAAEAGSRAKSEFLANMSHELRTPLNAILGLSQLLRQEIFGQLNPKQKEYVTCINSSGEHLLSLINDILDLSKVEAGKEELVLTPLLIWDICEYCLTIVREKAVEKGLQLIEKIDPSVTACIADERRLKQMLLNLLSNAIKFTPNGTVSLIVKKVDRGVNFTVADTGIGIASENLELLFQPFFQLDSCLNRQYDGTGLGLALTRKLAQLHGGDITVQSTLGFGSEFTIFLPDTVNFEEEKPIVNADEESFNWGDYNRINSAKTKNNKSRILIVEDDDRSALILQDYLQVIGHQVQLVNDGNNFLTKVRNFQPNLILLDIQLPGGVTGWDLLAAVRQEPDLKKIPVVICTAVAMAGDKERFLAAGANDYISKPVRIPQLESVLMQYLEMEVRMV